MSKMLRFQIHYAGKQLVRMPMSNTPLHISDEPALYVAADDQSPMRDFWVYTVFTEEDIPDDAVDYVGTYTWSTGKRAHVFIGELTLLNPPPAP